MTRTLVILAGVLALSGSSALAAGDASAITLEIRQQQGLEAINVQGQAPANAPITITLLATFSSDLPTVLVNRYDVVTDVEGHFGAVVPVAPAFERGAILLVVATSLPGVVPASAQLVMNAPNEGATVPFEQMPPRGAR